jgi:hypothetical protein
LGQLAILITRQTFTRRRSGGFNNYLSPALLNAKPIQPGCFRNFACRAILSAEVLTKAEASAKAGAFVIAFENLQPFYPACPAIPSAEASCEGGSLWRRRKYIEGQIAIFLSLFTVHCSPLYNVKCQDLTAFLQ